MYAELLAHFDQGDIFIYVPFLESRVLLMISSWRAWEDKYLPNGPFDLDNSNTETCTHAHVIHSSEDLWICCFKKYIRQHFKTLCLKIQSKCPKKFQRTKQEIILVGPFRIYNPFQKSSDVCNCKSCLILFPISWAFSWWSNSFMFPCSSKYPGDSATKMAAVGALRSRNSRLHDTWIFPPPSMKVWVGIPEPKTVIILVVTGWGGG